MPIGPKRLLQLVKKIGLVKNLSERELENPEGAGFDLRLGEIYELEGNGFLGMEERKTPGARLIAKYEEGRKARYKINPGDFVLVRTVEEFKLPSDLVGYTFSRTTLFRSGLILLSTQVTPGYEGRLIFGLVNHGPSLVEIELGSRIAHIQFERVEGGGRAYRGQWQGGRVATSKREKQL